MGQQLRDLEPERSAVHALGAQLRRWRVERGLSQARLGELILHSGSLVGKIEKGERIPSVEFCEHADRVLGTGGALVGMRPAIELRPGPEYGCFLEPAWSIEVSLQSARELTGDLVDRRAFLVFAGAALGATALTWSTAVTVSAGAAGPQRVGPGTVGTATLDRLAARLGDLRVLDDELGGTALRGLAIAELRWLVGLAEAGTVGSAEMPVLLGLIGEASRLCGWLHLDAELHAAAQGFYVTALRCSADAADPMLGVNVLAGMSFQATLTGHTNEALALLDVAEQRTRQCGSARMVALLASRRARAHARAGDERACGVALYRAETSLDAARAGDAEPGWLYFFDEAELAAQAGACWTDLRRPERAQPLHDQALHGLGAQYVRDRSIYNVRSAQSRLHDGELELACRDLGAAVTLAARTGSVRSVRTIRAARRQMDVHAGEPHVRSFDETFAGVLGRTG